MQEPILEPFVSAEVAAKFLCIKRRLLLSMARDGLAGSYSVGVGRFRRRWIFRLSELSSAIASTPQPSNQLQRRPPMPEKLAYADRRVAPR
jgi:hypothetical protein